jgi:3-hydroxyacyl-[acyl-carrier-protein] dehydratase
MNEVLINQPLLEGAEVSALIPQKPPMEMVDKLFVSNDKTVISGFTILDNNVFVKDGVFTEPGLVENIAQTAAIGAGYNAFLLSKSGTKTNPPVGYIGAIKKLIIHKLPPVGSELVTEVNVQQIVFDVTLIGGKTTVNGEVVAECEMKIFIKKV